jgi:hypothetical protein
MLPEFPELNEVEAPYRARYLFPTFAQRIPSPKRRDFDAIMASWGVVHPDNPLEVLAASGGVQMTDRIELSEHRPADDDLAVPLFFRVAGTRHYAAAEQVRAEMGLKLVREPGNEHDGYASMLVTSDERLIGYVPKQYSRIVARALDAGHLLETVAVRWLAVPGAPRRLVVRLSKI